MNKEQENRFKENIKKIARQELKNSFTDNLMETLNSAFIFKYVQTLEEQSKKYKEVIDKATEYIESKEYEYGDEEQDNYIYDIGFDEVNELLDILKGMK